MVAKARTDKMDGAAGILITLLSLLFPPLSVYLLVGYGPDLVINVLLTIWIWFPGVAHALYLIGVYFNRRDRYGPRAITAKRMPFIYSNKVQTGGAIPSGRI